MATNHIIRKQDYLIQQTEDEESNGMSQSDHIKSIAALQKVLFSKKSEYLEYLHKLFSKEIVGKKEQDLKEKEEEEIQVKQKEIELKEENALGHGEVVLQSNDFDLLMNHIKNYENTISSLENENTELRKEIITNSNKSNPPNQVQAQLKEVDQEIKLGQMKDEMEALENEYITKLDYLDSMNSKMDEMDKRLNEKMSDQVYLKEELHEKNNVIESLKNKNEDKDQKLSELENHLQKEICNKEALVADCFQLKQREVDLEEYISETKVIRDNLKRDYQKMVYQVKAQDERNTTIRKSIASSTNIQHVKDYYNLNRDTVLNERLSKHKRNASFYGENLADDFADNLELNTSNHFRTSAYEIMNPFDSTKMMEVTERNIEQFHFLSERNMEPSRLISYTGPTGTDMKIDRRMSNSSLHKRSEDEKDINTNLLADQKDISDNEHCNTSRLGSNNKCVVNNVQFISKASILESIFI